MAVRCINNVAEGCMKVCGYNSPMLEVGKVYNVVGVETHAFYTLYTLREFPGERFNSVDFCTVG